MKLIARTSLSNPTNNNDKATFIFIKLSIIAEGYYDVSLKFIYPDKEIPITCLNTPSKLLAEHAYKMLVERYVKEGYNIEEKEL